MDTYTVTREPTSTPALSECGQRSWTSTMAALVTMGGPRSRAQAHLRRIRQGRRARRTTWSGNRKAGEGRMEIIKDTAMRFVTRSSSSSRSDPATTGTWDTAPEA